MSRRLAVCPRSKDRSLPRKNRPVGDLSWRMCQGRASVGLPRARNSRRQRKGRLSARSHLARIRWSTSFLRVEIHPATGADSSDLRPARTRGNQAGRADSGSAATPPPRAPQRPGDIWRRPDEGAEYSTMVADGVEVTHTGTAMGENHQPRPIGRRDRQTSRALHAALPPGLRCPSCADRNGSGDRSTARQRPVGIVLRRAVCLAGRRRRNLSRRGPGCGRRAEATPARGAAFRSNCAFDARERRY